LGIRLEDEPSRLLLTLLDGSRTRTQLLELLRGRVTASSSDATRALPELTLAQLDALLARMAESGLLVA